MPLKLGQTIANGKYHLLEIVGQGSFARVWKAREFDPRANPLRLVAIKELKREVLTAAVLAEQELRFQTEIQVSTLLAEREADNVVRGITTEQATLEDGSQVPLLVLEYMPAGSVADLIKQYPHGLPVEQAVRYTQDLCTALESIHGHDLVHREALIIVSANSRSSELDKLNISTEWVTILRSEVEPCGQTASQARSDGTGRKAPRNRLSLRNGCSRYPVNGK